jgi:hypothetical protein
MIKWIKDLRRIVKTHDAEMAELRSLVTAIHGYVRNATEVDVDMAVSAHCPTTVITIGRYKNSDYVDIFQIRDGDLDYIVEVLRNMRKRARINRIDEPIQFRGRIKHDYLDI